MAKLAQASSKYTVYVRFDADGTVEKPDVIGAVFGQTEGLLGSEMDLRELQQTGRVGRIDVELSNKNGKTSGTIIIPSSLDTSETVLIAACIETIERIGPCNTKMRIEKIEDMRIIKRKYIIDRAKELLGKIFEENVPEIQEITEQLKEAVRSSEVTTWKGLPAGPQLDTYDSIIVVEGRADVVNLLRHGVKNVVAIEGTSVPQAVIELSKQKEIVVFLDGDRGGDLLLKELTATCDIDFVARAPWGKEVEELTKKEIFKVLRERVPLNQVKVEKEEPQQEKPQQFPPQQFIQQPQRKQMEPEYALKFKTILEELTGTRAAYFLDENMNPIGKVPVREMFNAMRELRAEFLIFDGEVDQKLINQCAQHGIKWVVGMKMGGRVRMLENVNVVTMQDLK